VTFFRIFLASEKLLEALESRIGACSIFLSFILILGQCAPLLFPCGRHFVTLFVEKSSSIDESPFNNGTKIFMSPLFDF
jgi:hypothetical protein